MSDLKLGADGDLEIKNGDLQLTKSDDAVRQHLQQRLRTFLGEWFLDLDVGVPYFQDILVKNPNINQIDGILKQKILTTPGVVELLSFTMDFDQTVRSLSIEFEYTSYSGEINFFTEIFGG